MGYIGTTAYWGSEGSSDLAFNPIYKLDLSWGLEKLKPHDITACIQDATIAVNGLHQAVLKLEAENRTPILDLVWCPDPGVNTQVLQNLPSVYCLKSLWYISYCKISLV